MTDIFKYETITAGKPKRVDASPASSDPMLMAGGVRIVFDKTPDQPWLDAFGAAHDGHLGVLWVHGNELTFSFDWNDPAYEPHLDGMMNLVKKCVSAANAAVGSKEEEIKARNAAIDAKLAKY